MTRGQGISLQFRDCYVPFGQASRRAEKVRQHKRASCLCFFFRSCSVYRTKTVCTTVTVLALAIGCGDKFTDVSPEAREYLRTALDRSLDNQLRIAALEKLGALRDKAVIPYLKEGIRKENSASSIWGKFLETLGEIGDESLVPFLESLKTEEGKNNACREWAIERCKGRAKAIPPPP